MRVFECIEIPSDFAGEMDKPSINTDAHASVNAGWWLVQPPRPEQYEFVNWDDEIPNIWENMGK